MEDPKIEEKAVVLFDNCKSLLAKKNSDYARLDNPWSNLQSVERLGICSLEIGILVRLSDKFSRLSNLISNNKEISVKTESISDTIIDAINYLALLHIYLYDPLNLNKR